MAPLSTALACSGRPVADFSLKTAPPAIRLLVRCTMFGALACFFLLPWAAMAASGAWKAGLVYFLPSMAMVRSANLRYGTHELLLARIAPRAQSTRQLAHGIFACLPSHPGIRPPHGVVCLSAPLPQTRRLRPT